MKAMQLWSQFGGRPTLPLVRKGEGIAKIMGWLAQDGERGVAIDEMLERGEDPRAIVPKIIKGVWARRTSHPSYNNGKGKPTFHRIRQVSTADEGIRDQSCHVEALCGVFSWSSVISLHWAPDATGRLCKHCEKREP